MRFVERLASVFLFSALGFAAPPCPDVTPLYGERGPTETVEQQANRLQQIRDGLRCEIERQKAERKRVLDSFLDWVVRTGKEELGEEKAELVLLEQQLAIAKRAVLRYQADLDGLHPRAVEWIDSNRKQFEGLVDQNVQSQRLILDTIGQTKLADLPKKRQELATKYNELASYAGHTDEEATALSMTFRETQTSFEKQIFPVSNYLLTKEIVVPDLTSPYLKTFATFQAALERGCRAHLNRALKIIELLEMRQLLLLEAGVESKTGVTLSLVKELDASKQFLFALRTALARVNRERTAGPQGLPPLKEAYLARMALFEKAQICNAAKRPSWVETGCTLILPQVKAEQVFFDRTLPREFAEGTALLRQKGLGRKEKIEQAEKLWQSQKQLEAITLYDEIVGGGR